MKWLVISAAVYTAVLSLGLISPVRAETVEMEYTDPDHTHAPKEVSVCNSALQCASVTYEYDANGNLVNDGERVISWNQDNLPTRIEKDGKVVELFYDADGRRIVKKSDQEETVYINQYLEVTQLPNNTITQKHYFANGKRVATRDQQQETRYFHQDHLGSTVLTTDSNSQKLTEPLSYFPYGDFVNSSITQLPNNSKYFFTGQEIDPESNLYNYKARLYDPETGAFISADPVQGPNRYTYAKNNPTRFTDPTGLRIPEEDVGDWPWRILPEDETEVLEELIIESHSITENLSIESVLQFALFMEEKFPGESVTLAAWEPVIPEATELFGASVVGAITQSAEDFPNIQCVGFARACARAMGGDIPPLGWEGLTEVGKELTGLEWYGSEDIVGENVAVAPRDILFYSRGETSHLAIITEVEGTTATLTEAVGTEFSRVGLYAPAGGIMVNERVIDLSTGQVTGMLPGEIVGWGVYRASP